MSLQFVIDGYNIVKHPLLGRISRKTEPSPNLLLELIRTKRLCGSLKNKVIVVFDGYPNTGELKPYSYDIDIIFSRDKTADELIKDIVEHSQNKKNIVVVSDDKEILSFIKYAGAKPLKVEEFISPRHYNGKDAKGAMDGKDLSKDELNYSKVRQINEELRKIWLE